jgi:type II secretory pathway component PulM
MSASYGLNHDPSIGLLESSKSRRSDVAYELVEFREPAPRPGEPYKGRTEAVLGSYESEHAAIEHGRTAWRLGRSDESTDVTWWIVRVPGEQLARWLADGGSDIEQVLDLTTNAMVPVEH